MPTTTHRAERWRAARARPAFALAIVSLHVLLAIVLVMRPAPRLRESSPPARWTTVRLLPPAKVRAEPEPQPRMKDERLSRPIRTPAPITLPAPPSPTEAPPTSTVPNTVGASAEVAAPAASAVPSPAIVIPSQGLARGTSRHPAMDDPRANRALESPGDRFARTLGTDDRIVEEWRGEGRHRVRQGTSCVDVKVARDAQLDPYNQNYRPTPRLVGQCP